MIEVLTTVAHMGAVKIFRFWSSESGEYVDLVVDFDNSSITASKSTDETLYNRSLKESAQLMQDFIHERGL